MSYKFDDFQACLNQTFLLVAGDYRDELKLIQVDKLSEANHLDGRDAFSVVFQSQQPEIISQQVYTISHDKVGEMQLFIVPIAQDETGVRYEAVFS